MPQEEDLIRKTWEYCHKHISLRELKEFSLLNIKTFLTSDNTVIARLVREIEGSVVEIEEGLLTEEDFRGDLEKILSELHPQQPVLLITTVSPKNLIRSSWKSESCYTMNHEFQGAAEGR